MKCKSVYYGEEKDWKCKHEEGHEGPHVADRVGQISTEYNYCSWTDEDSEWSFNWRFTKVLGGK